MRPTDRSSRAQDRMVLGSSLFYDDKGIDHETTVAI